MESSVDRFSEICRKGGGAMPTFVSGSEATFKVESSVAEERSARVTGTPDVSGGRDGASAPVALPPACLLFSEDKEFEKIPWDDTAAPLSFITTAEAISLLKKRGIKIFRVTEPIAMEDTTRQQRKYLKTDRAVWVHTCFLGITDVTFFLERVSFVVDKEGHYVKTH